MPITGECFCGEVTYRIDGKLKDGRSCHCSRCRKLFNAQASAVALVEPDQFKWINGESLLTSYLNQQGYGVKFCKKCGSTLCTVHNDQVLQVTLGCVNGAPEIEIGQHIYVGSKAHWEVIPDGVTQFETMSSE
ncbi:GFA family protein [Neptuniibacter sp. QD48_11]|uniref:GFA family protein n=1 Tax=unclassified Neptuniibacter TaxID=2630693 RepID=UPI0039F52C47